MRMDLVIAGLASFAMVQAQRRYFLNPCYEGPERKLRRLQTTDCQMLSRDSYMRHVCTFSPYPLSTPQIIGGCGPDIGNPFSLYNKGRRACTRCFTQFERFTNIRKQGARCYALNPGPLSTVSNIT